MATPAVFSEKTFFGDAIVGVLPENWIDARYAFFFSPLFCRIRSLVFIISFLLFFIII